MLTAYHLQAVGLDCVALGLHTGAKALIFRRRLFAVLLPVRCHAAPFTRNPNYYVEDFQRDFTCLLQLL